MFITGLVIAVGAAVVTVPWLLKGGKEPSAATTLMLSRQKSGALDHAVSVSATNILPDFFQRKYSPTQRAQFHVSSSKPAAVFVSATGVQIRTDSGWQPFSEEPRNEIWRLKPGTAQDVFVEIPEKQTEEIWRAYIRYGTEMHGPRLLRAQVREAWIIRSFRNWTGKAWGGGRFSGQYELFSEEFSK
jgi:hypothetical protein